MKSSFQYGLFCFAAFVLCSCQKPNNKEKRTSEDSFTIDSTSAFRQTLIKIDSTVSLRNVTYVAIPATGCSSCIKPAFEFLMDNYKNNEFFFIITEISDLQVLEKEFGKIVLESKNIRLDTGNHITFAFYSIYPQVFKFKNGRLTEHLQVDSKRVSLWDSLKKTHDPSL